MTVVKSKIKAVIDNERHIYAIFCENGEALMAMLELIEISNEALSDIEEDA